MRKWTYNLPLRTAVLSEAWAKLRDWASVAGRGRLLLSGSVAHASRETAVVLLIISMQHKWKCDHNILWCNWEKIWLQICITKILKLSWNWTETQIVQMYIIRLFGKPTPKLCGKRSACRWKGATPFLPTKLPGYCRTITSTLGWMISLSYQHHE